VAESVSLQKKKDSDEEKSFEKKSKEESEESTTKIPIKSEDNIEDIPVKQEIMDVKKELEDNKMDITPIKQEDNKMDITPINQEDIKKEEIKNEEIKNEEIKNEEIKNEEIKNEEIKNEEIKKEDIKNEDIKSENIKSETIDAMDVDEPAPITEKSNDKSSMATESDSNIKEKKEELNDNARKVMFHNIMDNSHIPLEDDMEFELYMYKFLCMQFGVENVTSENMALPIILDYFGSNEGVTYSTYDNDTSKLTINVNNKDSQKKKEDDNEKSEKSNNSGKKLWKVHIDSHCCTIDRKTLVSIK